MGFFGKLLDKWSKKEREDKERERLEAKRQDRIKAEIEKKREEILRTKNAKKLQLEDWKSAVVREESRAKEQKKKEELSKLDRRYGR